MSLQSDPLTYRAAQLLHDATHGECRVRDLSGDSRRNARRDIMSALMGRRCTIAESGVNAIHRAFCGRLEIVGGCLADQERRLSDLIQAEFGVPRHGFALR